MTMGWTPAIGDPSVMGWITVAAYFVAAILCARAALETRNATPYSATDRLYWLFALGLFLLLGINKQLDLQSLLTAFARSAAKQQDWYEDRRYYQFAFVALVGLAGLSILAWSLWQSRRASAPVRLAILGLALTLAFVVIRAASFHHVDSWLAVRFLGMKWNWLVELAGIATVATAAALYTRVAVRLNNQRRR